MRGVPRRMVSFTPLALSRSWGRATTRLHPPTRWTPAVDNWLGYARLVAVASPSQLPTVLIGVEY